MPQARGPEWLYVTSSCPDSHGNHELQCKFCTACFRGKASRIREHLLKCTECPTDVRDNIDEISQKRSVINSSRKMERLQASKSNSAQPTLMKMSAKTKNDKVDEAVSSFFFEEGIPFSKIESQALFQPCLSTT